MKARMFLFCFLSLLVSPSCGNKEPEAVKQAWSEFKQASLEGDGETAAKRVNRETHEYYEEIRKAALSAEREELQKMVFAKRFNVLIVRHRVEKAELVKMSGQDLYAYAVDQGWVGKNSFADIEITEIVVNGDHARATLVKDAKPSSEFLQFLKQDGLWRLDMMQMMKTANLAFDTMLEKSKMSEEEFVKKFLGMVSGKAVSDDLWVPLDRQ